MKKYFLILLVCALVAGEVAGVIGGAGRAAAQTTLPEVFLTWQAGTYVPPGYAGKIMPISDSPIVVGVTLVNQGQLVDLSSQRVLWYVNNNFYQGAVGLTRISVNAPHFIGNNSIQIRVSVPDYGTGPGRTITIPIVSPQVVLKSTSPTLSASSAPFTVQAYPYFYNVNDPNALHYSWSLKGGPAVSGDPFTVTAAMAQQAGASADLSVTVSNSAQAIESTNQNITLFAQ